MFMFFLSAFEFRFPHIQFHWALTSDKVGIGTTTANAYQENNRLLVSMGVPAGGLLLVVVVTRVGRLPALVLHNSELKQTRHMLENAVSVSRPLVTHACRRASWPQWMRVETNSERGCKREMQVTKGPS